MWKPIKTVVFLLLITLVAGCEDEEALMCWVLTDGEFQFVEITKMPEYINGGQDGFLEATYQEIKYPAEARENSIQGVVKIEYEITEIGEVTNIEIVEDIGGGCGAECVRVLEAVTSGIAFFPAEIDGTPVHVLKEVPIRFKLE